VSAGNAKKCQALVWIPSYAPVDIPESHPDDGIRGIDIGRPPGYHLGAAPWDVLAERAHCSFFKCGAHSNGLEGTRAFLDKHHEMRFFHLLQFLSFLVESLCIIMVAVIIQQSTEVVISCYNPFVHRGRRFPWRIFSLATTRPRYHGITPRREKDRLIGVHQPGRHWRAVALESARGYLAATR